MGLYVWPHSFNTGEMIGIIKGIFVLHRELVKMVVMFPLIIVRCVLIIVALLVLAIMSFVAGLGWCALACNAFPISAIAIDV